MHACRSADAVRALIGGGPSHTQTHPSFYFNFGAADLVGVPEYSLCSKIIAHLEFKICSTKECHFDPTIIKDKSFRRFFIKEIRHYLDPSHKKQGVF